SQKASTASLSMPAEANVSPAACTMRSSALRVQCSPNGVHPMPTMATRSLMPCEPISPPSPAGLYSSARPQRPGFPEVVVDAVGGEQLAERHLHPVANGHLVGRHVGELD